MDAREAIKLIDAKDALKLTEEELRQAVENLRKNIATLVPDEIMEMSKSTEPSEEGKWANYVVAFIAILNVGFLFKITSDYLGL